MLLPPLILTAVLLCVGVPGRLLLRLLSGRVRRLLRLARCARRGIRRLFWRAFRRALQRAFQCAFQSENAPLKRL